MEDGKKTGILTLSSAQNYGAVLQVFSLMTFLRDNYGPTEIIDFTPKFIIGRYKLVWVDKRSFYKMIISVIKGLIKIPVPLLTRLRFNKFRKNYFKYSLKEYKKNIYEDMYEQYIVGSDQVFNLSLTNDDENFFLPFVNDSAKKATYAASLGMDSVTEEQKEIYKKGLSDFTHLSIRESNGVDILKEIFPQKEIYANIDPVFLHNKDFWNGVASQNIIRKQYVLIYSLDQRINSKCIDIAKKYFPNHSIYLITDAIYKVDQRVENQRGVGPKQFLRLIRDAEYVITNSFHGCAFSIIFKKQFSVIPFEKTSSRMLNLLELLDLRNRLVSTNSTIDRSVIDYYKVEGKISNEINKARAYLDAVYS